MDRAAVLADNCADIDRGICCVIIDRNLDCRVLEGNVRYRAIFIDSVGNDTCGRGRIKLCVGDLNVLNNCLCLAIAGYCTEDTVGKAGLANHLDLMILAVVGQTLEIIERFIERCRCAHREAMGLVKALCGSCIAKRLIDVTKLLGGAYLVGRLFVGGIVRPIIIDRICKCGDDHMLAVVEALKQYACRCTGVLGVGNDPERICAEELLKRLARYIGHRFCSVGYEGLLKAGEDELIILAELIEHRHILIRVLEDYLRRIMIEQCIAGLGDGGRIVLVEVIHREAASEVGIADEGGVDKLHSDIAFAVLLVIREAVGVLSGIDPVAVMRTEHGVCVVGRAHLVERIGAILACNLPDVPVGLRAKHLRCEQCKFVIGHGANSIALDNGYGS